MVCRSGGRPVPGRQHPVPQFDVGTRVLNVGTATAVQSRAAFTRSRRDAGLAASGLSVQVAAGYCCVPSPTAGNGGYIFGTLTAATLTLAAADNSNPRIDLIVARVYDNGDSTSYCDVEVVTGTPATPPTTPSTTFRRYPAGHRLRSPVRGRARFRCYRGPAVLRRRAGRHLADHQPVGRSRSAQYAAHDGPEPEPARAGHWDGGVGVAAPDGRLDAGDSVQEQHRQRLVRQGEPDPDPVCVDNHRRRHGSRGAITNGQASMSAPRRR